MGWFTSCKEYDKHYFEKHLGLFGMHSSDYHKHRTCEEEQGCYSDNQGNHKCVGCMSYLLHYK